MANTSGACIRPLMKSEFIEKTSWSCAHGVERWEAIAAAMPERGQAGTRNGARRCARRLIGCATICAADYELKRE